MTRRIDHAIALLLLVALVIVGAVVLLALHDPTPPWLETLGTSALVGAGVAVVPGASPGLPAAMTPPTAPADPLADAGGG